MEMRKIFLKISEQDYMAMVKKRVKRRSLAKKRRVLNNQKNQIQISRMLSLQQADEATQTSEKGIAIENEQNETKD